MVGNVAESNYYMAKDMVPASRMLELGETHSVYPSGDDEDIVGKMVMQVIVRMRS